MVLDGFCERHEHEEQTKYFKVIGRNIRIRDVGVCIKYIKSQIGSWTLKLHGMVFRTTGCMEQQQ